MTRKKLYIDQFKPIIDKIINNSRYTGIEFSTFTGETDIESATIIGGIEKILIDDINPGDRKNFSFACDLLSDLYAKLIARKNILQKDILETIKTLTSLGKKAIEIGYEEEAYRYLDSISSNAEMLFDVGLVALKKKQFYIAQAALNSIENLSENTETKEKTIYLSTYLLSLQSHFWIIGESAKRRARRFFERMKEQNISFEPSLDVCIDAAIEDRYSQADYITADLLLKCKPEILEFWENLP